jgi:hypothetical protein
MDSRPEAVRRALVVGFFAQLCRTEGQTAKVDARGDGGQPRRVSHVAHPDSRGVGVREDDGPVLRSSDA